MKLYQMEAWLPPEFFSEDVHNDSTIPLPNDKLQSSFMSFFPPELPHDSNSQISSACEAGNEDKRDDLLEGDSSALLDFSSQHTPTLADENKSPSHPPELTVSRSCNGTLIRDSSYISPSLRKNFDIRDGTLVAGDQVARLKPSSQNMQPPALNPDPCAVRSACRSHNVLEANVPRSLENSSPLQRFSLNSVNDACWRLQDNNVYRHSRMNRKVEEVQSPMWIPFPQNHFTYARCVVVECGRPSFVGSSRPHANLLHGDEAAVAGACVKRERCGTGVFLPRAYANTTLSDARKSAGAVELNRSWEDAKVRVRHAVARSQCGAAVLCNHDIYGVRRRGSGGSDERSPFFL